MIDQIPTLIEETSDRQSHLQRDAHGSAADCGEAGEQGSAADRPSWRRRRGRHIEMLVAACGVIVLALVLRVVPGDRVALAGLEQYPLPHSCLSRSMFGMKCPGCGLTRSVIHLAHADWRASLAAHPIGWLMALAIAGQIPYRAVSLARPGREVLGTRLPRLIAYGLIAALIGNWFVGLAADNFR